MTIYLETGLLASKVEVEELLGLTSSVTVRLDIEEYLIGLTHLSNELVGGSSPTVIVDNCIVLVHRPGCQSTA